MLCNPPLSSIVIAGERAGHEAGKLLHNMMIGEKVQRQNIIQHPLYIVDRESTDILAIKDDDVVTALRFIRQHAREAIQVADVVNEVSVSRRKLQLKFKTILNRSIHDEIRRVHAELIAHMLIDTNMTITQIASSLNFTRVEHLSRCFQYKTNLSPLAYRRMYGSK